ELGLDKELGLEQLTVPARLWHGKSAASAETELQAIPEDVLAHPAPRPWTPIATPRGQIGLLRRFLCEKLKAANGMDPPGFEVVANGEEVSTETGEDKKHGAAESANDEPMAAAPAVVTADGSLPEQWVPIPEDEAIPVKLRYGAARAKVPPSNYLTHPRTHMHVGSGQLPAAAQTGRSAKKKPSKTTTTTTAAAAKSMVAATGGKSTKKK
ncbi:Transcriptional activator spt7, partial [Coemansia thaxteri]